MKTAVASVDYVGLSGPVLSAQLNEALGLRFDSAKVTLDNARKWPIKGGEAQAHFAHKTLDRRAAQGRQDTHAGEHLNDVAPKVYSRSLEAIKRKNG